MTRAWKRTPGVVNQLNQITSDIKVLIWQGLIIFLPRVQKPYSLIISERNIWSVFIKFYLLLHLKWRVDFKDRLHTTKKILMRMVI
jgi:EamA domain-containing membrane protein RarD